MYEFQTPLPNLVLIAMSLGGANGKGGVKGLEGVRNSKHRRLGYTFVYVWVCVSFTLRSTLNTKHNMFTPCAQIVCVRVSVYVCM